MKWNYTLQQNYFVPLQALLKWSKNKDMFIHMHAYTTHTCRCAQNELITFLFWPGQVILFIYILGFGLCITGIPIFNLYAIRMWEKFHTTALTNVSKTIFPSYTGDTDLTEIRLIRNLNVEAHIFITVSCCFVSLYIQIFIHKHIDAIDTLFFLPIHLFYSLAFITNLRSVKECTYKQCSA